LRAKGVARDAQFHVEVPQEALLLQYCNDRLRQQRRGVWQTISMSSA